jgi:TP901 family phage tail tape measure protein
VANEVNANIRVDVDTSSALASLRQLQSQISRFNQSVISTNSRAVATQQSMLTTLRSQIGASGQFSTSIQNVTNNVGRLQTAIDKNRLSMGEYFRYGVASSRTFGRIFGREHAEVMALATERVKKLQTQYVTLGESAGGMTRVLAVKPLGLFNADMAIGIQRSQLFNKLLNDGTTSLLNFGKNTQWAGRQLMVGFTIPLTIFGATASRIFMDLEKEAINFRKVYGDIFTTEVETQQALEGIQELSVEFTKYGIAVKDSMALANIAAQAGFRNDQLIAATTQATRLSVLGQMESQEAMKTTISLQTAFGLSNEQLADAVNFLNITENQSVLSLQDVAGAIPRVAPVINALGGDVKDLAVLLVAMKEGGVSAAEGANALKNSLGRLIVPTSKASGMARDFGIDLEGIVTRNKGQVMPMLAELAQAMSTLDGFKQQQLLSTIFGKFQYARIGALFKSLQDDASQASRILELTGLSTEQLAQTAEKELGVVEEAVGTKFIGAMERAKVAIAPVGEQFLKLATPILNGIAKIFEKFNELSPNVKNFITILVGGLGIITPVFIMLIGLTANFIANIAKGIVRFFQFIQRLKGGGDAVNYLSNEQIEAASAAASLEGKVTSLTEKINIQASAVNNLIEAYQKYASGATTAANNLPQGFGGGIPRTGGGISEEQAFFEANYNNPNNPFFQQRQQNLSFAGTPSGPTSPLNLENDPDNPFNFGKDLSAGYEGGIAAGTPGVVNAVKGMVQQAIQAIKNTQRSSSDAKETEPPGGDFGGGFATGIRNSVERVQQSVKSLVNAGLQQLNESVSQMPPVTLPSSQTTRIIPTLSEAQQQQEYTKKQQVNIKGGQASAHFAPTTEITVAEARQMSSQMQTGSAVKGQFDAKIQEATQRAQALGVEVDSFLSGIKLYSNQVVQVARTFNSNLNDGTAKLNELQTNLIDKSGFAHQELIRQIERKEW